MFISPPDLITVPGEIADMVHSRINSVTGYADSAFQSGMSAITALSNAGVAITLDNPIIPTVSDGGVGGIGADEPSAPTIADITTALIGFAGIRPSAVVITSDNRPIPEYNAVDYGFSIPSAPTVSWPVFDSNVPQPSEISIPTAPNLNLPPVPVLVGVSIPSPPTPVIPEFDGEIPVDDLTTPVIAFGWSESAYDSQLKARLVDSIFNNLVTGGSGLDAATEQAIYDRAVSRNNEEEQTLMDSVAEGVAARGFDIPPGAIMSGTLEAENKILRSRTDLNNDILVQQSNLAQKNTHFMYDKAVQIEQILIGYHNEMQNRNLDAQKFTVTSAIQVYQLAVEKYKVSMQAYGILAEVYKARIEAEIVKAEFYKAQIEGVKASVGVQSLIIEAYRAQVEATKALMESYKIQMQGAGIHAEIDRTRIQSYLGEVQAYVAQVNASTARYEGYKAQVMGETAKAEMHKADSQSYVAQVEGYRAASQVDIARSELQLNNTKMESEVYKADIMRYSADSERAVAEAEIQAKAEGLKIESFKVHTMKYAAEIEVLVKAYLGRIEEAKAHAQVQVAITEAAMRGEIAAAEVSVQGLRGAAQAAGQMAAGAMAAVNASLHAASSDSRSDYRGYNVSEAVSASNTDNSSFIVQHIYEHES